MIKENSPSFTRRTMLKSMGSGFGYLAFACLASGEQKSRESAGDTGVHFPASAKRVIFLCMNGGPSHVDLFDYKPTLTAGGKDSRERMPGGAKLLPAQFSFQQHGDSGQWISEALPHLSKHADKLCVVRSMHTDLPNHSQAFVQMHTGSFQFVRPSFGAWTLYGLGSKNENLPGFITVNPPSDNGGAQNYGNSFLPAIYQGTRIGSDQIPEFYAKLLGRSEVGGPPLKNIKNGQMTEQEQREQLDFIGRLNRHKLMRDSRHREVEGAIESFELAFRMQKEVPGVLDIGKETAKTLTQYGIGEGLPTDRFGRQCLLARRLAEADVRFIEITAPTSWDHHFMLKDQLGKSCLATDRPVAALLHDLDSRGLLEETLVIWAGEFGRTPYGQSGSGRDHNNKGYTLWMAGGGVKSGHSHGATDEFGYAAVEKPVHIHDWHATLLHLLGLDHKRLTFKYGGRDFRLTDIRGEVVREIIG